MKIKLLLSFLSLFVIGKVYSQNITITTPVNNGFISAGIAPNGTADHTTIRTHYIIPASELQGIPMGTLIDEIGVNIQAVGTGTPTGNLQFYVENTSDVTNIKSANWATATASMTSVYNGAFALPVAAGPVDFPITSPFTYTGGGLYLAYEYVGTTFGATASSYWVNTTLLGGSRTASTTTATPLDSVNVLSDSRPETRFTFVNPFTNNLEVSRVRSEYGVSNSYIVNDNDVYVEITNIGTQTVTNADVTLTLVGGATYSSVQTIGAIAPNASQVLTFSNVPVGQAPGQTIDVSVPADDQTFNDDIQYFQAISCDSVGFSDASDATSSVGFNTGAGLLGVRYDIPGTLPVNVKTIDFRVGNNAASVGNTIKGILLNSTGNIVDSTLPFQITAADIGQPISLALLNGNVNYANQTVFAGIRQLANAVGYFPIGIQDQLSPGNNKNFSSGINGGVITYQNALPQFMVLLTIEARPAFVISNTTTGSICAGIPIEFTTFPTPFDSYSLTSGGTVLQTNTTGIFTETPSVTTVYGVELELNGCISGSLPTTITVVSEYTSTLFEDICSNDSYNFNGQSLNTAGQYIDTLIAAGGCDSIITLNLDVSQATTSTLDEAICAGDAYDLNGQLISTSGTYTETIQNSVGCDSTITLNLTVLLEDMSVSQVGATLTVAAGAAGTTYQWIDCDNGNSPIPGATSQSFTPTDDMGIVGNYAVIVNSGNCSETSACTTIDFTSVSENEGFELTLFPNPVVDFIGIQTNMSEIRSYSVFDATGKLVLNGNFNNESQLLINTGTLATGTYFLTLFAGDKSVNKVFVK